MAGAARPRGTRNQAAATWLPRTTPRSPSIVATDGMVAEGPYPEAISGFTLVEVPSCEEALKWAAKIAVACRCEQEVREIGHDAELAEIDVERVGDAPRPDPRAVLAGRLTGPAVDH